MILHLAGVVVLLAGYSGAALVWHAQVRLEQQNASDDAANDAAPLSTLDSRTATRQVELNYGKMGLLTERFMEWAGSLTQGKGLAKTLIVLSSAFAIGCFLVAGRRSERN